MDKAAAIFLAFVATYVVFMYFAYRLAKVLFPKVNEDEQRPETVSRKERSAGRNDRRIAIKKA